MLRTTVFLPDVLVSALAECAKRKGLPKAEVVRLALIAYLDAEAAPWPGSVGMGASPGGSVTSANVKRWIRDERKASRGKSPKTVKR